MESNSNKDIQLENELDSIDNDIDYINISNYPKLRIPSDINIFDESNADWIFSIYLVVLEYLENTANEGNSLPPEDDYFEINDEDLILIYKWLYTNLFPIVSEKHKFEIILGIGALLSIDGIIEYLPEEMLDS